MGLLKALAAIWGIIRGCLRTSKKEPRRHWYPKHFEPTHVCYYCDEYDPEERELTDPPCRGKRRVKL